MDGLRNVMQNYVSDLKHICIFKNKAEIFNDWNAVFNILNL